MPNKFLVCIPTYGKRIKNQLILTRLLNSLTILPKNRFRVLILNTTDPYDGEITESINKSIARFKNHFPIMQATKYDVDFLRDLLIEKGFNGIVENITLKGFPNFRNVLLIAARCLREKTIFIVDDDNVVEDRLLARKVDEFIGNKFKGKFIYGKTGYYINENGTPYMVQQSHKKRKLWLKETYLNQALQQSISRKSRLNRTTVALGGVMVLHERLFSKVPFDPNIRRGEDTDYLINARQFGFQLLMDKKIKVRHLPPKKHVKYWDKLRQDIFRFVYEKEKLKYFNRIGIKSLEPFPAVFLKDDLEYRAVLTSVNYAKGALKRKRHNFYKESFRNIEILYKDAKMNAVINAPRYFEFQKQWVNLMRFIRKSKKLERHFMRFE